MIPPNREDAMNLCYRSLTTATFIGALLAAATFQTAPVQTAAGTSCESLAALALPNTSITAAQTVAAGTFTPPAANRGGAGGRRGAAEGQPAPEGRAAGGGRGGPGAQVFAALPAFCRVAATLTPSSDSDIKIEVWLPLSGWNGKWQAVGNGAFNGNISYGAMSAALRRGYATSSTDTGHTGGGANWALGHPQKVVDFGWRAVHEMAVASKQIVASHYDRAPTFSYWNGCSAGGRQGMKAAQRFPADFDGIIAGAPGLDWTSRAAQAARVAKVLEAEAVPKSKKLIKLKVDTGRDQRTIVAGIAEAYQPEQLVGRTIVVVANVQPAKRMGIESNGMVLAGSPDGGKPILVAFDQDVPPGSRVR
jgi:feruloyl esterase